MNPGAQISIVVLSAYTFCGIKLLSDFNTIEIQPAGFISLVVVFTASVACLGALCLKKIWHL